MKTYGINTSLLANSISRNGKYQNAKSGSPTEGAKTNEKKEQEKIKTLAPSFTQQAQSASDARKGALGQRLAQIKSQLEALMKLPAGSISPRVLRQLARELKDIVAEYKQLPSPAPGGMLNVSVNPTVAGQAGSTATDDAATAVATAAAAEVAAAETAAAENAPAVSAAEIEQALAAADDEAATPGSEVEEENEATGASPNPPNESNEKRKTGTVDVKTSAGNDGDRKFFELVKDLSQKLKFLLALVKKATNKTEEREIKDARKAVEDLDDTIHKAEDNLSGNQPLVADGTYEASGTTVPEVGDSAPALISEYA
ncbi:MAG: hypothetical protein FWD62_11500 [Betaproteobacteria bacterium]|nr:hypothetical protein [Betaproteobacteria bacterium]